MILVHTHTHSIHNVQDNIHNEHTNRAAHELNSQTLRRSIFEGNSSFIVVRDHSYGEGKRKIYTH